MNSFELFACFILICLSGYLSAAEIALFSLSRFQIKSIKDEFRTTHRKIKKLLGDPSGLLMTILMVNEIINIAISSMITEAVKEQIQFPPYFLARLPEWGRQSILGIVITAPIVLFLCELTPKVVAARLNRSIAVITAGPLTFLYEALRPFRWLLRGILNLFSGHRAGSSGKSNSSHSKELILKESDFLLMVEEGHKTGAIGQSELDLIKNVFELDDTTVLEVMTPMAQVISLPLETSIQEALKTFRDRRYSRIPILTQDHREIAGILYSKDLLRAKLDPQMTSKTVADLMRRPFFVRPNLRLNHLFRKFKRHKIHMAVIKEPQGQTLGVVTMNDILETVFEDLFSPETFRSDLKDSTMTYRYLRNDTTRAKG